MRRIYKGKGRLHDGIIEIHAMVQVAEGKNIGSWKEP